jgi:hypothetical protein
MRARRRITEFASAAVLTLASIDPSYALDSYRYLHVTIETPWTIFLFLLVAVLSPFILMAVLAWRFTEKRVEPGTPEVATEPTEK